MTEAKKTTAKTTAKKTATAAKKPAVKKTTATKTTTVKAVAKAAPKAVAADVKLNGATYATGKRKDSVARVYLLPGKGNISVNGVAMATYFRRPVLQMIIAQPFGVAKRETEYDIVAFVSGGGLSGQAGAVKHGISKALEKREPELRAALKAAGFLTRDSRVVERKHYGVRKARRSTQFSKR